jgi:hypothetical protein
MTAPRTERELIPTRCAPPRRAGASAPASIEKSLGVAHGHQQLSAHRPLPPRVAARPPTSRPASLLSAWFVARVSAGAESRCPIPVFTTAILLLTMGISATTFSRLGCSPCGKPSAYDGAKRALHLDHGHSVFPLRMAGDKRHRSLSPTSVEVLPNLACERCTACARPIRPSLEGGFNSGRCRYVGAEAVPGVA